MLQIGWKETPMQKFQTGCPIHLLLFVDMVRAEKSSAPLRENEHV